MHQYILPSIPTSNKAKSYFGKAYYLMSLEPLFPQHFSSILLRRLRLDFITDTACFLPKELQNGIKAAEEVGLTEYLLLFFY